MGGKHTQTTKSALSRVDIDQAPISTSSCDLNHKKAPKLTSTKPAGADIRNTTLPITGLNRVPVFDLLSLSSAASFLLIASARNWLGDFFLPPCWALSFIIFLLAGDSSSSSPSADALDFPFCFVALVLTFFVATNFLSLSLPALPFLVGAASSSSSSSSSSASFFFLPFFFGATSSSSSSSSSASLAFLPFFDSPGFVFFVDLVPFAPTLPADDFFFLEPAFVTSPASFLAPAFFAFDAFDFFDALSAASSSSSSIFFAFFEALFVFSSSSSSSSFSWFLAL